MNLSLILFLIGIHRKTKPLILGALNISKRFYSNRAEPTLYPIIDHTLEEICPSQMPFIKHKTILNVKSVDGFRWISLFDV